jgi:hypothetical protein
MRAWITKYALTTGIYEIEGEICGDNAKMLADRSSQNCYRQYFHKPHWHETEDAAKIQAEDMRKKKIASLKKSIAKFEKLTF